MQTNNAIRLAGQLGVCGHLEVFLGFAPAHVLHSASFADTLDEDTGEGYQRPCSLTHSRNFRQYILQPGTSTIPLTFNLREELSDNWQIVRQKNGRATLCLTRSSRCLARVDCQHRLGELSDSEIPLAYMSFIGLALREEMALFNVINSRAKGLSSSLTDYHESQLLNDLATEAPHLYIARRLNEDPESPWYRMIRYGGETTSGLKRRTSLRMMQKTVQRFLKQTNELALGNIDDKYEVVARYWRAVARVFPDEWRDHRHHLLTKGIGLYSLMYLLADIVQQYGGRCPSEDEFASELLPLKTCIDWASKGMFADAGGQKGAIEVYGVLKRGMTE